MSQHFKQLTIVSSYTQQANWLCIGTQFVKFHQPGLES